MWEAESFHPQSRTKIVNRHRPWNDPNIRITIQELWNRYNKYAESLKGNYDLNKQRDSLNREIETIKKKQIEIPEVKQQNLKWKYELVVRLDMTEEMVSEFKGRSIQITQSEE